MTDSIRKICWLIFLGVMLIGVFLLTPKSQAVPLLDSHLLTKRIILKESNNNPKARGTVGEIGLMQLRYSTAKPIAKELFGIHLKKKDLYNPYLNVAIGQAYLLSLIAEFGTLEEGLRAYNCGPANRNWKVCQRYSRSILKEAL